MRHPSDTDLQAYSSQALLRAVAAASALHLALALSAPRWGGGDGLPMFQRPPRIVRLEMLDLTPQPSRGEGEKILKKSVDTFFPSERGEVEQGGGSVAGVANSPFPSGKGGKWVATSPRRTPGERQVEWRGLGLTLPLRPSSEVTRNDLTVNETPASGGGQEGLVVAEASASGPVNGVAQGGGTSIASEAADLGGETAIEMWEGEEPPQQITFVEPEYPAKARRLGVEGSVVVRYLVGEDGRVEQAMALQGPELLREASLRAVGRFVYKPVLHMGRATKVWMRQVITFRLE